MTRTRDVGGHDGLGNRRYERYVAAFDWANRCIDSGYYLEAIAILDSLMWDGLSSRLQFVTGNAVDLRWNSGKICKALVGEPPSCNGGAEKDQAFREVTRNIQNWVHRRNEAIHQTSKILRSDKSRYTFAELLQSHRQDAIDGVKWLQDFDTLDTRSRESAAKRPVEQQCRICWYQNQSPRPIRYLAG